jgi:hypothetical protein
VLYVDDLDRCPPDRVVEVLEAVHLLLAGRLFVVAVDPRWLLSSITSHYEALFHPAQSPALAAAQTAGGLDPSWVDGPAQYLEKIFQIVLTLPPLAAGGYQRMIDSLVGVRADTTDTPPDPTGTLADQAARTAPPWPPRWAPWKQGCDPHRRARPGCGGSNGSTRWP